METIILAILISMSVIASGTTSGSENYCISQVRVPRNTVFKAPVMSVLKINCTVTVKGCHRRPRASWCKIYGNDCKPLNGSNNTRTELKNITEHEWMFFLVFLNISMEDTGLYRCKEAEMSVSHNMKVTLTDNKENKSSHNQSNTTNKNEDFSPPPNNKTDLNTPANNGLQWLWYFVYISSGILGLVFIVMIVSFLYIVTHQGRKSTRKDMTNENQYMETQKNDLLPPLDLYLNSDVLTSVVYRL